jgi:hypothetical protein
MFRLRSALEIVSKYASFCTAVLMHFDICDTPGLGTCIDRPYNQAVGEE